ncbi:MAG TPA: hypothetical protein VHO25_05745, partial [Polyangiaceae bacterium]|nr:hypothetical protein [Polyangiaceae bacterium]
MSFKKLAPLLLLTLSCSAESKCEDSLRCSGGQNEPTATAGNSNDSGTNTPQDSGTSRAPDGSPTNTTGVAG